MSWYFIGVITALIVAYAVIVWEDKLNDGE
jgi:hypothetical protein